MFSFVFLSIFTLFATTNNALALVSSDKMTTQILKMYDKNILVLNRGLEDGIFKGDHIKLTSEDGFIARGICLKTSMLLSHWKIYRVVRPQLVSKDTLYTLRSINQSQIPESLEEFQEVDFSSYYNDISDKDRLKGLEAQQERLAKYDLPESIFDAEKKSKKAPSEVETFIDENFDATTLSQNMDKFSFSLFASPMAWESLNQQRNMYFGFQLKNIGTKYTFELQGEQRETKIVDRFTKEEVEKVYTRVDSSFIINRFADNWSFFSYALFEQETQGEISNPKAQVNVGPVGFYYHLQHKNELGEESRLGFIPMFDFRSYEDLEEETFERSNARLGLRLYFVEALAKDLSFKGDFWYNPYFNLDEQDIDYEDSRTNLKAILNKRFTKNFSIEYQLQYLKDQTYKNDLGVNPENVINTINFRLNTEL